jgi:hypothetical protein
MRPRKKKAEQAIRINISISITVHKLANRLMELRAFDGDFSGFLHTLIREEYDRRKGPVCFGDAPAPGVG